MNIELSKYLPMLKMVEKSITTDFDKAAEDEIRTYISSIERSILATRLSMTIKAGKNNKFLSITSVNIYILNK